MGSNVAVGASPDYQALAEQLANMQSKAAQDQSVGAADVAKLQAALDAFGKDPNVDAANISKLQANLNDLTTIVDADQSDGRNNARWEQDVSAMDDLLRNFALSGTDGAASSSAATAALHDDFIATAMGSLPTGRPLSITDLSGLQNFLSANQGNLDSGWTAQAQALLARAASVDTGAHPTSNDVAALGATLQGSTTASGAGAQGTAVAVLGAADKAALPGALASQPGDVVKLDSTPPSYLSDGASGYSLFNAAGTAIGQFSRTQNAVLNLGNGSWLQLSPNGAAQSTLLQDLSKLPNPGLSGAYALKSDGTGTTSLGSAQDAIHAAAAKPAPNPAASPAAAAGSLPGADQVTPGGTDTKEDGLGGSKPYTWVTAGAGTQGNRTYVNFSPGSASDGSDSELYVNQNANSPVDVVGHDPSTRGPAGDGAFFLPDGSVAIKSAGQGYVLSGSVVTQIDTGSKTPAAEFFAAHPDAVPTSDKAGFANVDGSGQPTAAQQATMAALQVSVKGYGAGATALPKSVFDASPKNVDGDRHWLGVGDSASGTAYVQYDSSSKELFASSTSSVKSAIPVQGSNPANGTDAGALFLPDGSVAFKSDGDAYVESGDMVVSVTDPSKRQAAADFFAANPAAKPTSATAGFSNAAQNGVPTAAQATAMAKYGVQVSGAQAASTAAVATNYAPEPTSKGTTNVPGGGVVPLKASDANYSELASWPDVKAVVSSNAALAPATGKDTPLAARDLPEGGQHADGTLANEGWQAYSIPGAHTAVIYNPTPGVSTPLHAFDTTTGKEIALPQFLKDYGPSGSIVFSDGTRLDLKENGASNSGNDGLTFVSGDQITTSDSRVANGASLTAPAQVTDAAAVKQYMAGTRLNPFNTAVETGSVSNTQQFAYSNNETAGGSQAWGLAGDGAFGGESQTSLNWLNDPNSSQNAAVTAALFPDTGYAPEAKNVGSGWTDQQVGSPPPTKAQFQKQQAWAAFSVLTTFIPGIGEAGAASLLGANLTKGLEMLASAAGLEAKDIVLLGTQGLKKGTSHAISDTQNKGNN